MPILIFFLLHLISWRVSELCGAVPTRRLDSTDQAANSFRGTALTLKGENNELFSSNFHRVAENMDQENR
jgi:hypothetical protein